MCFSLQRRANFPQPNFQKRSDAEVFCAFWLGDVLRATAACHFSTSQLPKVRGTVSFLAFWLANVLRATAACHFSTSQLPKVLRRRGVLNIFIWHVLRATAACHFSCLLWAATSAPAALASLLFDSADTQTPGKTQHLAAFLTFRAIVSSFFLLDFSSLLFIFWLCFSALLFQLSILSEVRLLNFLW